MNEKLNEEDWTPNGEGLLKYDYPEVVSSFYKGPKGNLVKMYSLKNNYPLLKRKECKELRIEYFLPLLIEKFSSCVSWCCGSSVHQISPEDEHEILNKKDKVIKINMEDQKKLGELHLEAAVNQEKKNEFIKSIQRKSLHPLNQQYNQQGSDPARNYQRQPIPPISNFNNQRISFIEPIYDNRNVDPNFIDQRRRRDSQFTKLPVKSPMY